MTRPGPGFKYYPPLDGASGDGAWAGGNLVHVDGVNYVEGPFGFDEFVTDGGSVWRLRLTVPLAPERRQVLTSIWLATPFGFGALTPSVICELVDTSTAPAERAEWIQARMVVAASGDPVDLASVFVHLRVYPLPDTPALIATLP